MKNFILLSILIIVPTLLAQDGPRKNKRHFSKRFEELEKIKLLEILELDEETTLKFFTRRNKNKKNMKELLNEGEEIYAKMEEAISKEGGVKEYDSLIEESLMIEKKMINEKSNFIKSLSDILTKEKILKLVLFERNFKRDVRDLLIERGRRKFSKEKFIN